MTQQMTRQFDRPVIGVYPDPPNDAELLRGAARLAVDLDLPLLERPRARGLDMLLVVTPVRLELRVVKGDLRGGRPVYVNFSKLDTSSAPGRSRRQPIARSVGLARRSSSPTTVVDATAGFGEDAWLLASLGCRVLALERDPVVAALLRDGLVRAAADSSAAKNRDFHKRLHLVGADAKSLLSHMARADRLAVDELSDSMRRFCPPDVIYIDPMFPPKRKTTQRKPLRVLRQLVGEDADAPALLQAALAVAKKRVVVKRPLRAAPLGDQPTSVHRGKAMRYDVYGIR